MKRFHPRFLVAFNALVRRLGNDDYFAEIAGQECDGYATGVDFERLEMLTAESTGLERWILSGEDDVDDNDIISLIEAVYGLVSEPVDKSGEWHDFCGRRHFYEFDARNGRFEYTKSVNKCLGKFTDGLRIEKGKVKYRGEVVPSNSMAVMGIIEFGDAELDRLLGLALQQYSSWDGSSKVSSLTTLANAVERAKTILDKDKKRGSAALLQKAESDAALREPLESYLRQVTDINNSYGVRHSETHQEIIFPEREDLVEFWFSNQWSLLRYFAQHFGNVGEDRPF